VSSGVLIASSTGAVDRKFAHILSVNDFSSGASTDPDGDDDDDAITVELTPLTAKVAHDPPSNA
jgi:hypothetical protein